MHLERPPAHHLADIYVCHLTHSFLFAFAQAVELAGTEACTRRLTLGDSARRFPFSCRMLLPRR